VSSESLKQAQDRRSALIDANVEKALDIALSNADRVGPDARHKLKGILKHYAHEAHPFAACVRDNRKRFGDRAEAVCAVVKDIIRGTTHWRGKNNPNDKGSPGVAGLSEDSIDAEIEKIFDSLAEDQWDAIEALLTSDLSFDEDQ
jgi:hypothetical protein